MFETEIKRLRRVYKWTNDGEAFAHLLVQYRFDFEEDEAARCAEVGRAGRDKGIDAYYIDEDLNAGTGTLYLVQTKSSRKTYSEDVLFVDVRKAIEFLRADRIDRAKSSLRDAMREFRRAIQKKYDIVFVVGLNGRADKVREAVPNFESQFDAKYTIEVFDLDDLRALVMRSKVIPHRGPDVVFELSVRPLQVKLGEDLPDMLVSPISAQKLAECVRKHRLAIFSLNVREYLGTKNPVNKVIKESLKTDPKLFYYLNLGLDAICDSYRIDTPADAEDASQPWVLTIKNFQIINGCQTAKTLSEEDPSAETSVMLRLINPGRQRRDELIPQISVAKNRQSPIRGRDLFAWDSRQLALKREFERLGIFFETREKEWDALVKARPEVRKTFPEGKLDNVTAARAHLCVILQDPFRAKHRKREFFQHGKDGGVFEKIFADARAEQMLFATLLYNFISKKCKLAGNAFRELEIAAEERSLTDEERRELEELTVIWNGDTFLASLTAYFIERWYDQPLREDENLKLTRHLLNQTRSSTGKSTHRVLDAVYDLARETTVQDYLLVKARQPTPE